VIRPRCASGQPRGRRTDDALEFGTVVLRPILTSVCGPKLIEPRGHLCRAPVEQVSLVVPDSETEGVEVTGPRATLQGSAHHGHLIRRDVCTAGVAHLSVTRRIVNSHHSSPRQKTVLKSAPDDEANYVEVQQGSYLRKSWGGTCAPRLCQAFSLSFSQVEKQSSWSRIVRQSPAQILTVIC
jgi:hypothetical protein